MADTTLVDRLTRIQGIRPATAENVARAFPTEQDLAQATQEQLTEVKGIGAVTAARIVEAFAGASPIADAVAEPVAPQAEPGREAAAQPTPPDVPQADDEPIEDADATVTSLDDRREQADATIDQLRLAAKAVGTGAVAVAGTVRSHLPEVRDSVGKAAGAVVQLGRELTRALLRRAG